MVDDQKDQKNQREEREGAPKKDAAPAAAKPSAAKPPAKEKPGPKPHEDDGIRRLRARFGDAIGDATIDRDQVIVVVNSSKLVEIAVHLRDEEKFDLLSDLTAVDWYEQEGRSDRYDVILNLYSVPRNESLRLKVYVGDGAVCPSVSGVWSIADWLERECYDMFGIKFEGHPNLTRILLPEGWEGHPLRKDYDILAQDDRWVRENLGIESGQ